MKKLLFISALTMCMSAAIAQDKIVMNSGDVVYGKVEEVGVTEIKYKKKENPTGPVYVVLKNDVYSIHYENGTQDLFAKPVPPPPPPVPETAPPPPPAPDQHVDTQDPYGDDVYNDRHHHHNKKDCRDHDWDDDFGVEIVVPVIRGIGWLILADIVLNGCW